MTVADSSHPDQDPKQPSGAHQQQQGSAAAAGIPGLSSRSPPAHIATARAPEVPAGVVVVTGTVPAGPEAPTNPLALEV